MNNVVNELQINSVMVVATDATIGRSSNAHTDSQELIQKAHSFPIILHKFFLKQSNASADPLKVFTPFYHINWN
jgi:hypothetical protein